MLDGLCVLAQMLLCASLQFKQLCNLLLYMVGVYERLRSPAFKGSTSQAWGVFILVSLKVHQNYPCLRAGRLLQHTVGAQEMLVLWQPPPKLVARRSLHWSTDGAKWRTRCGRGVLDASRT